MYYLNSRYYNPEVGRFINADGLIGQTGDILGHNMYAYAKNNPVMYSDPSGEIAIETIILIVAIIAGAGAFTYTAVDSYNKTGEVDWLGATVNGFLTFGTVYTMGTFVYESYLTLCFYMGWNPVVGIGAGGLQYMYTNNGWKVGQPITNNTRAGNRPSWATVKSRYWKNQAYKYANSNKYSPSNLNLMRKGNAPKVRYPLNGKSYSMELHHPKGRKGNNFWNFKPLTPWQHSIEDPYRHWRP